MLCERSVNLSGNYHKYLWKSGLDQLRSLTNLQIVKSQIGPAYFNLLPSNVVYIELIRRMVSFSRIPTTQVWLINNVGVKAGATKVQSITSIRDHLKWQFPEFTDYRPLFVKNSRLRWLSARKESPEELLRDYSLLLPRPHLYPCLHLLYQE